MKRIKKYFPTITSYIIVFASIGIYAYSAMHHEVEIPMIEPDHRRIIVQEHYNVYQDHQIGFSLLLPSNTYLLSLNDTFAVIGRGNPRKPDYLLYVAAEQYDQRIEPTQYIFAQKERLIWRAPIGSSLSFSQMFDQKRLTGLHMSFIRGTPYNDVTEHVILATQGKSVWLQFHYPVEHRYILEPETTWIRNSVSFSN